jgi:uncharacterized protein YjeT (DUF2065 family)
MHRTRISLYYVAGYLIPTGLGLMFAPQLMFQLLMANGQYDDVFPRFSGVLMVALGVVILHIVRTRSEALYPTTLLIRAMIWVWVLRLFLRTGDPFFAVVLGVVGLGMVMTGSFYLLERRARAKSVVSSTTP